jgi:hypothetical protein
MSIDREAKRKEDLWFRENEHKLLADIRAKREKRIREELAKEELRAREELKKLHWMCCPKCGHQMDEQDLKGILVDVCTLCEGIYFDRGELEDLLKKNAEEGLGFFRRLLGVD